MTDEEKMAERLERWALIVNANYKDASMKSECIDINLGCVDCIEEAAAMIRKLAADKAKLVDALRPFVYAENNMDSSTPDEAEIEVYGPITAGDLRRARAPQSTGDKRKKPDAAHGNTGLSRW